MLAVLGWLVVQGFFFVGFIYMGALLWFGTLMCGWNRENWFVVCIMAILGVGNHWAWGLKPFSIIFGG